jgi:hypothetical protein
MANGAADTQLECALTALVRALRWRAWIGRGDAACELEVEMGCARFWSNFSRREENPRVLATLRPPPGGPPLLLEAAAAAADADAAPPLVLCLEASKPDGFDDASGGGGGARRCLSVLTHLLPPRAALEAWGSVDELSAAGEWPRVLRLNFGARREVVYEWAGAPRGAWRLQQAACHFAACDLAALCGAHRD